MSNSSKSLRDRVLAKIEWEGVEAYMTDYFDYHDCYELFGKATADKMKICSEYLRDIHNVLETFQDDGA